MRTILREPLVHFALLAVLIFVAFIVFKGGEQEDTTILVTQADMERMARLYTAEARTPPSEADMRAMVLDYIKNTALSREARRLGLDEGDTIVERRLTQKMMFMIEDMAEIEPPSEEVLKNWYDTNSDEFTAPARYSFDHVYFQESSESNPTDILAGLNADDPIDWKQAGDPFMLQRQYGDLPEREIIRLFGSEFVAELSELSPSQAWQGPVKSAFGDHIVRLNAHKPAQKRPYDAAKSDVLASWTNDERRTRNAKAVEDIIARYDVQIEGADQ